MMTDPTPRPASIGRFDIFYLGSILLALLQFVLSYDQRASDVMATLGNQAGGPSNPGTVLVGSIVFGTAIGLALWFLVSRLRVRAARWALVLFFAWSVVSAVPDAGRGLGALEALTLAVYIMQAVAIAYLFRPETARWMRQGG